MDDWVEIHGFSDYEVNSEGLVRQRRLRHILKPYVTVNGRLAVNLYFERQRFSRMVHQLVAVTFIGPSPYISGTVRHRNHDYQDNHVDNLVWVPKHIADSDTWRDRRGQEYVEWPPLDKRAERN